MDSIPNASSATDNDSPSVNAAQIVAFVPPEAQTSGLYKVKPTGQRTSIWDGMVQLATPMNEDEKAAAESQRVRLIRRKLCLLLVTVAVVVGSVIGLSVGLATTSHSSTKESNPASSDETATSSTQQYVGTTAPPATEPTPSPTTNSPQAAAFAGNFTNSSTNANQTIQASNTPSPTATPTPLPTPAPTPSPTPTTRAPTPAPTPPPLTSKLNFLNLCPYTINLYKVDTLICTLGTNALCAQTLYEGEFTMYRHNKIAEATLVEMTMLAGKLWYDISIIPPGCGNGVSWSQCVQISGGLFGFNVPVSIRPTKYNGNPAAGNCHYVECLQDECPGAYLYPTDDLKMRDCPDDEVFLITYCPS